MWSASAHLLRSRQIGDMPANDDRCAGLVLANQPAHPPHLEQIGNDRADADDVVLLGLDLFEEPFLGRIVQQRARGLQVDLDQHQSPRPMERTEREGVLHPRHLVVKQLHRDDQPVAVLIVLGVGAEDADQQHPRLRTQRMHGYSPERV